MTSATAGWGVSADAVFRTADGGRTWHTVLQPSGGAGGSTTLTAAFYGSQYAWAVSAAQGSVTVYRTADDGARWNQTTITAPAIVPIPGFVDFADVAHGWLWAPSGGGGMGFAPGTLYATTDGGSHWTAAATVAQGSTSTLPQEPKTGMALSATAEGWFAGAYPSGGGSGFLVASLDGGKAWTEQQPPIQATGAPVTGLSPVVLGTGTLGLFVQRTGVATAAGPTSSGFQMDTSTDGGKTWRAGQAVAVSSVPHTGIVWSFPDAMQGIVTNGKTIYVTADAGDTWASFAPNRSLEGVAELDFISPQIGFAVIAPPNGAALLRTADGGHIWTAVS